MKNLLSRVHWVALSLGITLSAGAQPVDLTASSANNQSKIENIENAFSFLLDIEHFQPMRNDLSGYTDLAVEGTYKINSQQSFTAQIPFSKYYSIPQGADEVQINDIRLDFNQDLPWQLEDISFKGRLRLTLPTSMKSMDSGLVSKPQVKVTAKKNFFNKRAAAALTMGFDYFWKTYKQKFDGSLLPHYSLGAEFKLSYELIEKKLELSSFLGLSQYWLEKSANQNLAADNASASESEYSLGAELAYQWNKKWQSRLSYSQGDQFVKNGHYEMVFFDPDQSTVSLGLTLKL